MSVQTLYTRVSEFMLNMNQLPALGEPVIPSRDVINLRLRLAVEEANETADATDIVEAFDGILDSLYVVIGTAIAYGISREQLELGFKEVHASNMSKLWKKDELHLVKDDYVIELTMGNLYVVKDKHGKVVKSPSFRPPDLKGILGFE